MSNHPLAPHSADPSAEHFQSRYPRQMAEIKRRLRVPAPDEIYSPNAARLSARPRFRFGEIGIEEALSRAADPRFAPIVAHIHQFAAKAVALPAPPSVDMIAHDPNRAFADSLVWMATSLLIDTDPARRATIKEGLLRWIRALCQWGPFENNLPLAQSTIGLSVVYDWLHAELTPEERSLIRAQIIQQARLSLDESRGSLSMWRGQRFAANHNWAHHSARAFAALSLWGEEDASLAPGELKFWLDDALEDFWIVKHTHSTDGAPLEGANYQDYGLRFYLDFIGQAEWLLNLRETFFDEHIQALWRRLFVLLPGNAGAMVYADGHTNLWGASAFNFRRLASHFQDGRAQLTADLIQRTGANKALLNWRDLFAFDPDLAPASIADIGLVGDFPDFGLFTARSGWDAGATFFGLRCGSLSADSVVAATGEDFGEGHMYTDQGDVNFYAGERAVLACCSYASTKLTSSHHLVVFEGRSTQEGRMVGQLGEGGAWFNSAGAKDPDLDYASRARCARTISFGHGEGFHHYLCDLGGVYRLRDERVPAGYLFPGYLRSVVFLPDGAVAIVDRVCTSEPRTSCFRLLVAADALTAGEDGFQFNIGDLPGAIHDFSPVRHERATATEALPTIEPCSLMVASLRAVDAREAVYAAVISVGEAVGRYVVEVDGAGYFLRARDNRVVFRMDWPESFLKAEGERP